MKLLSYKFTIPISLCLLFQYSLEILIFSLDYLVSNLVTNVDARYIFDAICFIVDLHLDWIVFQVDIANYASTYKYFHEVLWFRNYLQHVVI